MKKAEHTFVEATKSYFKHCKSEQTRSYLRRIARYFKNRTLSSITPIDIREMALDLYPDCMDSTRNRHGITPARSVMIHAHESPAPGGLVVYAVRNVFVFPVKVGHEGVLSVLGAG